MKPTFFVSCFTYISLVTIYGVRTKEYMHTSASAAFATHNHQIQSYLYAKHNTM